MNKSWLEVDIVEILQLKRAMQPAEIDDLLDEMTKEIWYRILNEDLREQLDDEQFHLLASKFDSYSGLDEIMNFIAKNYPEIKIAQLVEKATSQVKKEFVKKYLEEMKKDYEDEEEIVGELNKVLKEIEKQMIAEKLAIDSILKIAGLIKRNKM